MAQQSDERGQSVSSLAERVGPRNGQKEAECIARADAALDALSSRFRVWLDEDVDRLTASRETIRLSALDSQVLNALFTSALDLKGLGTTYGFPIVTRIAASLCKLLGEGDNRLVGPQALIDAHVDAIRIAVRDDIRAGGTATAEAVARQLEDLTSAAAEDRASVEMRATGA